MKLNREKELFVKAVLKELEEDNLAIFAGAGLSVGAGFVDWRGMLRPIADELELDISKVNDLVSLAQYHCNENGNNRSKINDIILNEFSRNVEITSTHSVLSALPISTYWTTNYDKLIESALEKRGKCVDVKHTNEHLTLTKRGRDTVLYKMHGDVDFPSDAILTKDDYEQYHLKMEQYLSALKGDLISKTFVFIGFSFTDPNLDYILSRVRISYEKNQRQHFCFIRVENKNDYENEADFEYHSRRQELFINDLKRFGIKAIKIKEYFEITDLLREVESRYKRKTVFISGAAYEYGQFSKQDALFFLHKLSAGLIESGFRIVSGFGLGVGSSIISGALEKIYMHGGKYSPEQLILRPFPYDETTGVDLKKYYTQYRTDMISHAGVAIFLFGNKLSRTDDVVLSDGMREEFEICIQQGIPVILVGATGYMAKTLLDEYLSEQELPEGFVALLNKLDGTNNLSEMEELLFHTIKNACEMERLSYA
ncbi:SIR2 family protein [Halodesulfovibrio aestuarii]|uniref:SIR2 family protein n=1 Tax=Halodesulfovibrio aestuarii TaxID=126333 RepID=UPI003D326749